MGEWFPILDRIAEDAGLKKKSGNTDSSLINVDNIAKDVLTGAAGYTMSQHIKNRHKKRL
ncbi:MAG: hypothetical protein PVF58_16865 [Candidatus Methanofastidiosia archaeon]|jgi:hypothetical protein